MLCDMKPSSQRLLEPSMGADPPLISRGGFTITSPTLSPALFFQHITPLSAPECQRMQTPGCRNTAVPLRPVIAGHKEGHPSPFCSSGAAEPQPPCAGGDSGGREPREREDFPRADVHPHLPPRGFSRTTWGTR